MSSLLLSICLVVGQPCKELRVADFYTSSASRLCETNKVSMQAEADKQNRKGTFSCVTGLAPSEKKALVTLNLNIANQGAAEDVKVADFYGKDSAAPVCAKNAEILRPALETSAKATGATVKVDCMQG
ncbi:hypothetical protein LU11_gp003 [Pseudomonas phage Lu11]|uniref:hypothetical protein n=1 Tax=Pseudomonas phage Lu11 TaxID=1161927 RepID=UPI00025F14DD|nr:hypothetical protein LU11_gp003 [Pseudomonas phage Lu11]AFH14534.1 hypothetical protein Lu11_0003 [Pseudomonas phage Lu11]